MKCFLQSAEDALKNNGSSQTCCVIYTAGYTHVCKSSSAILMQQASVIICLLHGARFFLGKREHLSAALRSLGVVSEDFRLVMVGILVGEKTWTPKSNALFPWGLAWGLWKGYWGIDGSTFFLQEGGLGDAKSLQHT